MLNAVIRLALQYRMLVIFVSLTVLIYGGYVAAHLPIDVFPDLDRPRVVILTEAPHMAPEDVETLITVPLESAVLGATGVQAVRSQSAVGQSIVWIEFDWDVPIFTARQIVQEKLASLEGTLPHNIKPQMGPISSLMGQIMLVGVSRQKGPGGGVLAPVGKSKLMAELIHDADNGRLEIAFLNPRGDGAKRNDPRTWTPVTVKDQELALEFAKQRLRIANGGESPDKPFRLIADPDKPGRFLSTDARLRSASLPFGDRERRLSVTIGRDTHEVTFPSFMQA
jgi:AcrB/AcrD/AcrF family